VVNDFPPPNDIEVTVKSVTGACPYNHKAGDRIYFDGKTIRSTSAQGGICYNALMVLLPKIYALQYGAEFPWEAKDGGVVTMTCGDDESPVFFEIRKIKK